MNSLVQVLRFPCQRLHASRLVHTTSVVSVDYKWRRVTGRPEFIRDEPEFLDSPDYSFLDGRPTPIGDNRLLRYEDEIRLATKAVRLLSEIDDAVARTERKKLEKEEEYQAILGRKLKPKGPLYRSKYEKKETK